MYNCEVYGEKTSSMIKITFYLDSLSAKRKKWKQKVLRYMVFAKWKPVRFSLNEFIEMTWLDCDETHESETIVNVEEQQRY